MGKHGGNDIYFQTLQRKSQDRRRILASWWLSAFRSCCLCYHLYSPPAHNPAIQDIHQVTWILILYIGTNDRTEWKQQIITGVLPKAHHPSQPQVNLIVKLRNDLLLWQDITPAQCGRFQGEGHQRGKRKGKKGSYSWALSILNFSNMKIPAIQSPIVLSEQWTTILTPDLTPRADFKVAQTSATQWAVEQVHTPFSMSV